MPVEFGSGLDRKTFMAVRFGSDINVNKGIKADKLSNMLRLALFYFAHTDCSFHM